PPPVAIPNVAMLPVTVENWMVTDPPPEMAAFPPWLRWIVELTTTMVLPSRALPPVTVPVFTLSENVLPVTVRLATLDEIPAVAIPVAVFRWTTDVVTVTSPRIAAAPASPLLSVIVQWSKATDLVNPWTPAAPLVDVLLLIVARVNATGPARSMWTAPPCPAAEFPPNDVSTNLLPPATTSSRVFPRLTAPPSCADLLLAKFTRDVYSTVWSTRTAPPSWIAPKTDPVSDGRLVSNA